MPQRRQSVVARHLVIRQHQVEGLPLQGGVEFLLAFDPHDVAGEFVGLQPEPDQFRIAAVVFQMQQSDRGIHAGLRSARLA
jgi:hypothetical protein